MDRQWQRASGSGSTDRNTERQLKVVAIGQIRTQPDSGENGVLTFVL